MVEARILDKKYVYKNLSSTKDNAMNNETNSRVYRDWSTDIFTTTMLSDDEILNLFLD